MRARTLGAALLAALCLPGRCEVAASEPDAAHWQAMARKDLDAVRALVLEAHPVAIDPSNPHGRAWVDEGYEQALRHLPHVISYDTAMAAVRSYVTGFEDVHFGYSDAARGDDPIWVTGWNIDWHDGRYVVVATVPDWPQTLPPVGAVWEGCDGQSAEEALQAHVGPFVSRLGSDFGRRLRMATAWLRLPVEANFHECSFRLADGELVQLPVEYHQVTPEQFFATIPRPQTGEVRGNGFEKQGDMLWIRAGNFDLAPDSQGLAALEEMLDGLEQVGDAKAIVFDMRGSTGGDSSIGGRIFEAATGGLEFDRSDMDALPRYFAQWRVSNPLIDFLDGRMAHVAALYGPDSSRLADERDFLDRLRKARDAGEDWVVQDAGPSITREEVQARGGHLRKPVGKVVLLTDGRCVSACLDFADKVMLVPGAIHVGQTTDADSIYMVGAEFPLPSGNWLVMPVKVWRNRVRGNNEPYVPDVEIDLSADEAAIQREVRRSLGLD
jgi:hypothetical protein